jgi:hypothetical protein
MAVQKHDVQVLDSPTASAFTDRVIVGQQLGVANAGGGAGVTVSTVVTFLEPLPPSYTVLIGSGQGVGWFVSAKTMFGFTVNLVPFAAGVSVASGTFDVTVIAA